MLDPDESVSEWYAVRASRRLPEGTRDALPFDAEDRRGRWLFRDSPHLVVEWDGKTWNPVAVADSYAGAYPLIAPNGTSQDAPVLLLRKGTGRHRRS